jgi:uncharacterized membrane protein YfcA
MTDLLSAELLPAGLTPATFALVLVAALSAGWIDAVVGGAIGFYDGILGPGTGSFLVFAMVSLLGYDFLAASAKAKIVNWATNLAALLFFAPHGSVFWGLGIG